MPRLANSAWKSLALPILALGLLAGAADAAAPGDVEPYYWRQRVFFVPYQPSAADPQASKIDKVQLLVSRDGGRQWAMLQEAEPHVRGFSYHAAADGPYDFALRMSDRRGNVWPERIAAPLLRVVVDTQPPQLRLDASVDATGRIVIRYEATDQKLKPQSLQVQAQVDGGPWERLALDPPDVVQPDRLLGKLAWRAPDAGRRLALRAAIEDAAGNPGTSETETTLAGPALDPDLGPQLSAPTGGEPDWYAPAASPPPSTASAAARPPVDWPAGPSLGSASAPSSDPFTTTDGPRFDEPPPGTGVVSGAPPAASTSTSASSPPTHFASDVSAPALLSGQTDSGDASSTAQLDAAWTTTTPPAAMPTVQNSAAPPATPSTAAAAPAAQSTPWVNSATFDLDYELQTVGPYGVSQVHLWGTRDGGRQWQRLGADEDNRSPMRVTVPAAGVYGFRIVVDGGNGVAAPTPQPGDAPELVVGVDLTPPQAELKPPQLGQGAFAGQALIAWSAQDERLAERPIALFYSAAAEGPWSTIATNLDNAGHYAWQPGRDAPPQVFLRLEVRDAAGNVTVQQTPQAVDLNLPRPTGRLRNVRPAPAPATDPNRYRTAAAKTPHLPP